MIRHIAIAAVFFIAPSIALAQAPAKKPTLKRETAKMTSPADGAEMYRSYCAACHGVSGKGDGPAAKALNTKPSDLTQLAKRHGGTLPSKDFEDQLTGSSMAPAHGDREMPIWGPIFKSLQNDELRIYNLKKYVESIQTK